MEIVLAKGFKCGQVGVTAQARLRPAAAAASRGSHLALCAGSIRSSRAVHLRSDFTLIESISRSSPLVVVRSARSPLIRNAGSIPSQFYHPDSNVERVRCGGILILPPYFISPTDRLQFRRHFFQRFAADLHAAVGAAVGDDVELAALVALIRAVVAEMPTAAFFALYRRQRNRLVTVSRHFKSNAVCQPGL